MSKTIEKSSVNPNERPPAADLPVTTRRSFLQKAPLTVSAPIACMITAHQFPLNEVEGSTHAVIFSDTEHIRSYYRLARF